LVDTLKLIAGGTGGIGTSGSHFLSDADTIWATAGGAVYITNYDTVAFARVVTTNDSITLENVSGDIILGTIDAGTSSVNIDSFDDILDDYDDTSRVIFGSSSQWDAGGRVGTSGYKIGTTITGLDTDEFIINSDYDQGSYSGYISDNGDLVDTDIDDSGSQLPIDLTEE
jgi:hypothetical protein